MKKTIIVIFILLVIISIIITLFFINNQITGKLIEEDLSNNYSYTKAICDDEKYCQDNIIECDGNRIISITPITGAAVQFPPSWEDPRTEEEINKLCG